MTRQILWLYSDSTRPSHDSTLTRLEGLVTRLVTRQIWLVHITGPGWQLSSVAVVRVEVVLGGCRPRTIICTTPLLHKLCLWNRKLNFRLRFHHLKFWAQTSKKQNCFVSGSVPKPGAIVLSDSRLCCQTRDCAVVLSDSFPKPGAIVLSDSRFPDQRWNISLQ